MGLLGLLIVNFMKVPPLLPGRITIQLLATENFKIQILMKSWSTVSQLKQESKTDFGLGHLSTLV